MEQRKLSNWLDAYMEYTEENESPLKFRRWTAISSVAAALQRRIVFPWFGPDINIYPNMYIILVGPSGVRKGTAMAPAKQLLKEAGVYLGPDWVTKEALVQAFLDAYAAGMNKIGEEPVFDGHHSMTIFSPELSVLIKERDLDMHFVLCQLFDADSLEYRTKHDGPQKLFNVWFNLLGATTPRALRETFPATSTGYGLTSRLNFIYADKKHKVVTAYIPTEENKKLRGYLIEDLQQMRTLYGTMQMSAGWFALYDKWVRESEEQPPVTHDPRFEGYQERRRGHLAKLSMICTAAKGNELLIQEETFHEALVLLKEAERGMSKAFAGAGRLEDSDVISSVLQVISRKEVTWFGDLLGQFLYDVEEERLLRIVRAIAKTSPAIEVMLDTAKREYKITFDRNKLTEETK